jgi:hypothetical protein
VFREYFWWHGKAIALAGIASVSALEPPKQLVKVHCFITALTVEKW